MLIHTTEAKKIVPMHSVTVELEHPTAKPDIKSSCIARNKHRAKLKNDVVNFYSLGRMCCQNCQQDDIEVLTVDHINNDGNVHRKSIKSTGGSPFYQWIRNNNFPDGFQILCFNCQMRKQRIEAAKKNTTAIKISVAKYVQKIRNKCLDKYGGTCSCGERDNAVLTLDHVENDGASHRREIRCTSGRNFYLYLQKNNYPNQPKLQVLCANCQNHKKQALYNRQTFNRALAIIIKAR